MSTPRDYDTDPGRYRLGMRDYASHTAADLYARIVNLLVGAGHRLVLDVGSGDAALAAGAAAGPLNVINADASETMTRTASVHGPTVRSDVTALPVADTALDAVVAVNVLDHLPDPAAGLHEILRVLRPGGLFVAGVISRADSPELAPQWRPTPTPFDAEDAPALVADTIGPVELEPWDAALVVLPGPDALRDYLVARFVPADAAATLADAVSARVDWPLPITKRGALIIARRRRPRRDARRARSPISRGRATDPPLSDPPTVPPPHPNYSAGRTRRVDPGPTTGPIGSRRLEP